MQKTTFKNPYFKVCQCDVKRSHIYFYPDIDDEDGRFPTPFTSIEAAGVFVDVFARAGYITPERKEELLKFVKEANLEEKADKVEQGSVLIFLKTINDVINRKAKE